MKFWRVKQWLHQVQKYDQYQTQMVTIQKGILNSSKCLKIIKPNSMAYLMKHNQEFGLQIASMEAKMAQRRAEKNNS